MSKVRVYELARELKIETKQMMTRLKELGIIVASHQSTLTPEQITRIRKSAQGGADLDVVENGTVVTSSAKAPTVIRRRRIPSVEAEPYTGDDRLEDSTAKDALDAVDPTVKISLDEAKQRVGSQKELSEQDESSAEESENRESNSQSELQTDEQTDETSTKGLVEHSQREAAKSQVSAGRLDAPATDEDSDHGARLQENTPLLRKERKIERPASQGATIVRRASPEEVMARKTTQTFNNKPTRTRPADGGGARVDEPRHQQGTDGFDRQARKPQQPQPQPQQQAAPETEESKFGRESRGGRGPDRKHRYQAEGPAEEEVKKTHFKSKRDTFNLRSLLEISTEVEEEETEEKAALRRKTVYTPVASSKKRDLKRRKDLKKTQVTLPRASYRVVKMGAALSVAELGKQLGAKAADIIKKLMAQGVMASINQEIDFEVATVIAADYGFEVQSTLVHEEAMIESCCPKSEGSVQVMERPPIVTIMGHVDHGKTSILDAIRKTKVAAGEAGGITQAIGAYTVEINGKKIAFLDTPGHEAFSAMRSRGARTTDIVVLVVAADDGVMPQTIEAIAHAREAHVPIIVAINKIDKPNTNLDRIYRELMEHAIQWEEWGGENQFVKVSALDGTGIDDLLEAILLQAEVLELTASPSLNASGIVVEAYLDKGRGPIANVMVQDGTLRVGEVIVAGMVYGKVRAMRDHTGKNITEAGPSTPVEVVGLPEIPLAGDRVNAVSDEKAAKELVEWRIRDLQKRSTVKSSAATIEELLKKVTKQDTPVEVPVIVKADTQGSVEAVVDAVLGIKSDKVKNRVVHKGVGGVSESDIILAETSGSIIVAFNVRAGRGLNEVAEQRGVPIKYFSIIYDIVDALKSVMAGSLPPVVTEVVQGHAEVRATIKVPKVGVVAGTSVTDGKITRNSHLRLIRDDVVIFSGKMGSLRRFKDDVREVVQGYECGIGIEGYNDIKEGDIIESYVMHEEMASI